MSCYQWNEDSKKAKQPSEGENKEPSQDPYVRCKEVLGLEMETFAPFLQSKDVALVLFYQPDCQQCEFSRKHFKKAAKSTNRPRRAYAAVNCEESPDVCCREKIPKIPYFKLYSRGKLIGINDYPRMFTHTDMKNWVETTVPYKGMSKKGAECKC